MISGADIVKSPIGKTPAGSIGAYVNIKTARPLENPGLKIAGSINSKHNDLSGDNSPQYSGIFSNAAANVTLQWAPSETKDISWGDPNLSQYNTCGTYRD